MAKRIPALVEPAVLVWARETAGYSREEVAERLGKDAAVLESWERGPDRPLMGQLRKLADIYRRPLSDFYLPAPPQEKPIPHDFRREPGAVALVYSPALRRQLRLAQERRELALALYEDIGEAPPPAPTESITLAADPESVGLRIREILGVEFEEQHRWGDGYDAYNAWRRRLEAIGLLVFQFERVLPRDAWGFSFVEKPLPVIGVNRALAANGRTFTMLHEFTHILLGESSICDIDDYTARGPEEMRTEVFCNHVAAAALMPRRLFLEHELVQENRAARDWNDDVIRGIAKTFGVSREAAVRRLLTFDLTDQAFYVRKRVQYIREREEQRLREQEAAKDNAMKRNMPREAISNLGRTYVRLILLNYHEDRITLMDASEYLGVRAEKVRRVEELTSPW
jgi:Zn-dependent peptidase ImmA (M78 family)/DNA-binding XRE family transcriptional regulator